MSTLITYDNGKICGVYNNFVSIRNKLSDFNLVITETNYINIDDLVLFSGYAKYRFYNTQLPFTKKERININSNHSYVMIRGTCRFYFYIDNILLELDLDAGYSVTICPDINFYFNHLDEVIMCILYTP